jgi:hypothetical protein
MKHAASILAALALSGLILSASPALAGGGHHGGGGGGGWGGGGGGRGGSWGWIAPAIIGGAILGGLAYPYYYAPPPVYYAPPPYYPNYPYPQYNYPQQQYNYSPGPPTQLYPQ